MPKTTDTKNSGRRNQNVKPTSANTRAKGGTKPAPAKEENPDDIFNTLTEEGDGPQGDGETVSERPARKGGRSETGGDTNGALLHGVLGALGGIANRLGRVKPSEMDDTELVTAFSKKATRTGDVVREMKRRFGDNTLCIVLNTNGSISADDTLSRMDDEGKRPVYKGKEVVTIDVAMSRVKDMSPFDPNVELEDNCDQDGVPMPENEQAKIFIGWMRLNNQKGVGPSMAPQLKTSVVEAVEKFPVVGRFYTDAKVLFGAAIRRKDPTVRQAQEQLTHMKTGGHQDGRSSGGSGSQGSDNSRGGLESGSPYHIR